MDGTTIVISKPTYVAVICNSLHRLKRRGNIQNGLFPYIKETFAVSEFMFMWQSWWGII